jgi:hypothetical protein
MGSWISLHLVDQKHFVNCLEVGVSNTFCIPTHLKNIHRWKCFRRNCTPLILLQMIKLRRGECLFQPGRLNNYFVLLQSYNYKSAVCIYGLLWFLYVQALSAPVYREQLSHAYVPHQQRLHLSREVSRYFTLLYIKLCRLNGQLEELERKRHVANVSLGTKWDWIYSSFSVIHNREETYVAESLWATSARQ